MKEITLVLMFLFGCCGLSLAQKSRQATEQEKKEIFQLILKDKNVGEALPNIEGGEMELSKSLPV